MTSGTGTPTQECAWNGCDRAMHLRGYCSTHYRRRLHTGRYGYRDATAAREHVAKLRALGWTWHGIAQAAGLSPYVPHRLHTGQTRRLLHESLTALLSVPLEPVESHRGVDATGSRRRVQALTWMGWPNREVSRRIGCSPRSLPTLLARGRISQRLALRIAAVYDEISGQPGPSKGAASKARLLGFAPPAAWEDDAIDNPRARPHGIRAAA